MNVSFSTTALSVLLLLAMAIPGFIVIKTKVVKASVISGFAAVLLYVSQPFLSLRSFLQVEYTKEIAINLLEVFAASLVFQAVLFVVMWLILRRQFDDLIETEKFKAQGYFNGESGVELDYKSLPDDVKKSARGRAYRMMVLTSTFGNVGFFGIPILQVLFSNPSVAAPAIAYASMYVVTMNLMFWTVGAYVITGDKQFISIKKAILNPQTITLVIAIPLFFGGITMTDIVSCPVPQIATAINYLADSTAPLSMIILGMRFALVPIRDVFTNWRVYVSSVIKLVIFPVLAWAILIPIPMDPLMKMVLIILSGMPSATFNLNLAEMFNGDQKNAANSILFSTLFSMLTIPAIVMLAQVSF